MKLAPIVLFVYNRLEHTKKTVKALKKNELAKDSVLYIYSDGAKNEENILKVKEIRNYIKTITGFKDIIIKESKNNKGLANSIINGVTEVIDKHGKVIVLEDDLVTSPVFLNYMNHLLEKYENEKKLYSITGYNHPKKIMKIPKKYNYDIYFNPRAASWSWATWKDRWDNVDWDIKDFDEFLKNQKKVKNTHP
jgi:GT2 family glycosyltransferase